MREAMCYEAINSQTVICHLCAHQCQISDGKRGRCNVRENRGNMLFTLNYGYEIASHVDPIEKKPIIRFLSNTSTYSFAAVGCNLTCQWCQNWEISQNQNRDEWGYPVSPETHVRRAIDNRCPSISYTYSEPTVFAEYALDTMILAREAGLKNIWVSNGMMGPQLLDLIMPVLDAVNIDLKGTKSTYHHWCKGDYDCVCRNLVRLKEAGVHVEVTTLIIPSINDHPDEISTMARFIADSLGPETPWHLSRFFPAGKLYHYPITPIDTLFAARKIGLEHGLKDIILGNV